MLLLAAFSNAIPQHTEETCVCLADPHLCNTIEACAGPRRINEFNREVFEFQHDMRFYGSKVQKMGNGNQQMQVPKPMKLLYVMNIPSPYRWHLFTRLHEIGASRGIDFHVAFMSSKSVRRRWRLEDFPRTFPFFEPSGINLSQTGDHLLNPGLILSLLYERWDWVILGGYDNPTTAMLAVLPLLNTRVKLIRNEGNLQAQSKFSTGPAAMVKRLFLSRCDGYFVPGQRGIEWLNHWLPERGGKPVYEFPNVIDDRKLILKITELRKNRASLRKRLGVAPGIRLFVTPARLSAEKGLIEFIQCLPDDFGENNIWLIAGEGPLREEIEHTLLDRQLHGAVKLLGYWQTQQMPELYAAADVFVLPSLSDPNPLSAIEAAFAGLPLLISRRIGNAPELLIEHQTGWSFEPTDRDEVQLAIQKAVAASDSQLSAMANAIAQRADTYFASDKVCQCLIDFLLQIHPNHSPSEEQYSTRLDTADDSVH